MDILELLLARGADPAAVNHEGKTALDIARARGHSNIVQHLERRGS